MSTRATQTTSLSAAGNLSRREQGNSQRKDTMVATTIGFSSTNSITDSANGLAVFPQGTRLRVRGSPLNSRMWVVTASAAGTLTVSPALVQTEAAGATIQLSQEN